CLRDWELIEDPALSSSERRGGWLKMGMSGTTPARDAVLLAGDAAGLINPLAGEGISGAILSGRDAAEAILRHEGQAAEYYRAVLWERHGAFHPTTAPL